MAFPSTKLRCAKHNMAVYGRASVHSGRSKGKKMERIILGDNQFFGVNHMSEEKARAQAIKFQDISEIINVLQIAYEEGIRAFMCTTHERIAEVCEYFRKNQNLYSDFAFYPCMPYAHKYANAVTEVGLLGALSMAAPKGGILHTALKGGLSLARKDVEGLAKLLIDAEMKMFKGLKTPIIFLQNVVTDLLLGLGVKDAFRIFSNHVRQEYGAEPGFITMNMPMLLDALDDAGIKNPIVCANINKIGFRVSGGITAYEEAIRSRDFRPIAMSIFASGAINPSEAVDYVNRQEKIAGVVFGASSRFNIKQTVGLLKSVDL
jgi:hypothetical protein